MRLAADEVRRSLTGMDEQFWGLSRPFLSRAGPERIHIVGVAMAVLFNRRRRPTPSPDRLSGPNLFS